MLVVLAGLPEPTVNHIVRDPDTGAWLRRFELAYRELLLAIEYEGRQHRDDDEIWAADIERREELDRETWRVVQVISKGLFETPLRTLQRIDQARVDRGRSTDRLPFRTSGSATFPDADDRYTTTCIPRGKGGNVRGGWCRRQPMSRARTHPDTLWSDMTPSPLSRLTDAQSTRRQLLAMATVGGVGAAGVATARPRSARRASGKPDHVLTVLGTTDLHGNVYNWDYFKNATYDDTAHNDIGVAKAASLIRCSATSSAPRNTLTLDAGDTIQGTPLAYYYAKIEPITRARCTRWPPP